MTIAGGSHVSGSYVLPIYGLFVLDITVDAATHMKIYIYIYIFIYIGGCSRVGVHFVFTANLIFGPN